MKGICCVFHYELGPSSLLMRPGVMRDRSFHVIRPWGTWNSFLKLMVDWWWRTGRACCWKEYCSIEMIKSIFDKSSKVWCLSTLVLYDYVLRLFENARERNLRRAFESVCGTICPRKSTVYDDDDEDHWMAWTDRFFFFSFFKTDSGPGAWPVAFVSCQRSISRWFFF